MLRNFELENFSLGEAKTDGNSLDYCLWALTKYKIKLASQNQSSDYIDLPKVDYDRRTRYRF